ncbi:MAG: hypothetical protein Fur0035_03590 [Anaerolineales bacterium]
MPPTNLILLAMEASPTLSLLERALRASGYGVALAADSATLKRALAETSPALLLIHETLKGQSGLDLARATLERFPTLPVILFADHDNAALMKQCMKTGLSDFLAPPLRIDEIVQAIQRSQKRAEQTGDWVRREVRRSTASLEQRVNEMETMMKLGRTINSSLDEDNVLTSVVTAAVELTGAEEGQLLLLDKESGDLYMRAGRNFEENFARAFRLPVKDSMAGQVIHSGKALSFCEDSPNKIKTSYLVYALVYVPLTAQGEVIGVLGVDNRQNKRPFSQHHEILLSVLADYAVIAIQNAQSYQKIEQEHAKLETTLSSVQDGILLLDQNQQILLMNPAVRRIFGLGSQDFSGQLVFDVIQQRDFAGALTSISENPLKRYEITFDDGQVFNCQVAPIPAIGSVVTLEDITHLKMLDRLKSDFIHTISHDLRSPLTAIMGYVELLERVGPLNEQQKLFIRNVQNSTQNITALVNDLLDLGRIESGFDDRKDEVSLETILRYTLDNLNQQIVEKHQVLTLNVETNPPAVRGNPIRLRQMVDNLLVNAVKYTPAGGSISVGLRSEDGQVIFEVADSGIGIPAADQAHIFEKFYRAANAPKNAPGTGLGLAIVKSIVENHQGRIWLESSLGQGSKFTVVLPAFSAGGSSALN